MADMIFVALILLIVGGLGTWFLHGVFGTRSRRDELQAELYHVNYPYMTWKEAGEEADFWLDYTKQK